MQEANALVAGWMREAGLETREDAVRNLIGRRGDGPVLMLGSHLDTVVDAGRYDGPLGVLIAIEAAERVPRDLEVVGLRRRGGRAASAPPTSARPRMTGRFDPAWLEPARRRATCGSATSSARSGPARDDVLGYVEVHIEQGPVLERLGEPVGVVTAINGQSHAEVTFVGEAGHAGTVPMEDRRDALTAAAEWILAVERAGGTVGRVAGRAERAQRDPRARDRDARPAPPGRRDAPRDARRAARARPAGAATSRSTGATAATAPPSAMDERLTAAFGVSTRLPSGAGHDAAMMAHIAPTAMLFVRSRGGSHNPAESVEEADVAVALDALERLLRAV